MIHAPFNFVPLSEHVFYPDWADQISQDVPFRDGVSGTIDLEMTARTPVFVRNGHRKDTEETSFSHTSDNKYFIPATSIKGCIRSVLEILGFGKMSFVDNKSFGLRDINNHSYRENMKGIHCGWLQIDKDSIGNFVLYDWGIPKRISIEAIAEHYNVKELSDFITKEEAFSKDKSSPYYGKDCTSVKYKYDLLVGKGYDISYAPNSLLNLKSMFSPDTILQGNMRKKNPVDNREFYKFGGSCEGYVVLTGQSGIRQQKKDKEGLSKWTGKLYEFIFLRPDKESKLDVSKNIFEAFNSIHEGSPAYSDLWKSRLLSGERIPVFFKLDAGKVHSLGLSYMYKYPYIKNTYDAIPFDLLNPKLDEEKEFRKDLPDCIFGYTFKTSALRGRVQWGHAKVKDNPQPMNCKKFITLSPHSSYYPIYVEDSQDWNHAGRISGRKRYLIREVEYYKNLQDEGQLQVKSGKVDKGVCLLPANITFRETVHFHNLTYIELGALLSAITFHGNHNKCFHSIGFGKPFGYGKMQVNNNLKLTVCKDGKNKEDNPYLYMCEFEKEMDKFIISVKNDESAKWLETSQLKELFTIANGIGVHSSEDHANASDYYYMSLNEYRNEKRNNSNFRRFTEKRGDALEINSIEGICNIWQQSLEERLVKEQEEEEKKRKQEEFKPTSRKVKEIVTAHCFANKKVNVDGHEYDTSLIIGKYSGIDAASLIGKDFDVMIKQISKAGKIIQVEYIEP